MTGPGSELLGSRDDAPSAARYTFGDEIARGGMGRVVEAIDVVLGREVAVKEALHGDDEALRRFSRETLITARLQHPSIVPVYDAGVTRDGAPFYVMRRVTGEPLGGLVAAAPSLNGRLALLPHVLAAAQAVAHAHSRGVIHRDLKPSNILIGALGETVVIDWGLAKVVDEPDEPDEPGRLDEPGDPAADKVALDADSETLTKIGTVYGTPGFMSPEQLRGEAVDASADVYALGATLHYVLAQRAPHATAKSTGDEMMVAALAGPPPSLGTMLEDVPAELVTIVDRALSYDRDVRYADAHGVVEDLRRFLSGQLVASHRYSRRERLVRFVRRHRIAVAIGTVASVALVVLALISIDRLVAERNRTKAALRDTLEQNEQLVLSHARSLLATNPTAAIVRVKPIADRQWRSVRSIAAAARAKGVARGLPASRMTTSLELTRDGNHALSAGDDGAVRLHDLVAGSSKVVAQLGSSMRATHTADERAIIAWGDKRIVVIDAATGQQRAIASPVPISTLAISARAMWWAGSDGTVWSRSDTEPAPSRIAVTDHVEQIAIGGGAIAIGGREHLWIIGADGLPTSVADGHVWSLAWSPDGKSLAALVGTVSYEVAIGPPIVARKLHDSADAQLVAWRGGPITGGTGRIFHDGGWHRFGEGKSRQVIALRGDALLVTTDFGDLVIVDDHARVDLPPTQHIDMIAASPTSRFAIAGARGAILVWDLDAILPREIALDRHVEAFAAEAEQILGSDRDGLGVWIDTRTGKATPFTPPRTRFASGVSPEGTAAMIIDNDGDVVVYHRGNPTGRALGVTQEWTRFVSARRIAITTRDGELRLYDTHDGSFEVLAKQLPRPVYIEARGGDAGWLVLLFEDGSVLRRHLATKTTTQLARGSATATLLRDDGELLIANGPQLHRWDASGTMRVAARALASVTWLYAAADDHVLAFTNDDGGTLFGLGDHSAHDALPPGTRQFEYKLNGHLASYVDSANAVWLADPLTATAWRVGAPGKYRYQAPQLSREGTQLSVLSGDRLLVWSVRFPDSRDATLSLIASLTNARALPSGIGVDWGTP